MADSPATEHSNVEERKTNCWQEFTIQAHTAPSNFQKVTWNYFIDFFKNKETND